MEYNDLQDLKLAGVVWEITDFPMVSTQNIQTDNKKSETKKSVEVKSNKERTLTSIVPSIVPTRPVSLDIVKSMAARPSDMLSLNRMIEEFNHPLKSGSTNVVLPHIANNPNGLVVLTDIPSVDDDTSGNILSGPAGDLLDKMLLAINMTRENVSMLPLVFWRTPGGRTLTDEELSLSKPFVEKAIELLKPKIILCLGNFISEKFCGGALSKIHGDFIKKDNINYVPIYHPNYLMLKPSAKREVWNCLQKIENLLKNEDK